MSAPFEILQAQIIPNTLEKDLILGGKITRLFSANLNAILSKIQCYDAFPRIFNALFLLREFMAAASTPVGIFRIRSMTLFYISTSKNGC